jgi:hypothetical protein
MKQVRIILKSGKELNFFAKDEETNKEVITAIDGAKYAIVKKAVEATIITPMEQCKNCNRWMIPEQNEITHAGDPTIVIELYCPYCGCPDEKTINDELNYVKNNG